MEFGPRFVSLFPLIVVTRPIGTIRYRTPLCVFFLPRIVAAACFILAQCVADGPHSPSLDARISASPPSASLPTPPSHKPGSPDASRFAIDYFGFSELELHNLAGQCIIPHFGLAGSSRPTRCSQYTARVLFGPGSTSYHACFLTHIGQPFFRNRLTSSLI